MGHRCSQLYVTAALAADLVMCNLNAAAVADYTFISY
jgi:hypothetical protein